MELKVGDRVKYIGSMYAEELENKIGTIIIKHKMENRTICRVKFEDFYGGHNLGGELKGEDKRSGLNVCQKYLVKLESKEGNINAWF